MGARRETARCGDARVAHGLLIAGVMLPLARIAALCCLVTACSKPPYAAGDRVIVEQKGLGYEAKVTAVDGEKLTVAYVDYTESETVPLERVRAKVAAAGTLKPAAGDKVLVRWEKAIYEAKFLGEGKGGKLKVAYDGESGTDSVAAERILAMAPPDGLVPGKKGGAKAGAKGGGSSASGSSAGAESLNAEQQKCKEKQASDARWVFCAKPGQEAWGVCVRTDVNAEHCGKCFHHCKSGDTCDPNASGGPLCHSSTETTTYYSPEYTY